VWLRDRAERRADKGFQPIQFTNEFFTIASQTDYSVRQKIAPH
jgi:hypothetical protein